MVETFGTGKIADEEIVKIIRENFDLRPAGMIQMLELRSPIYRQTAAYGHFGRTDIDLPWERLDKVKILKVHDKRLINITQFLNILLPKHRHTHNQPRHDPCKYNDYPMPHII